MLPFSNQSHNKENSLWQSSSLLNFLGLKKTPSGSKKLERIITGTSYLPPIIKPINALDDRGK